MIGKKKQKAQSIHCTEIYVNTAHVAIYVTSIKEGQLYYISLVYEKLVSCNKCKLGSRLSLN